MRHVRVVDGTLPRKSVVMTGESVQNGVDEDVYQGECDEAYMAREASDGDRRVVGDADQAVQLDISGQIKSSPSFANS